VQVLPWLLEALRPWATGQLALVRCASTTLTMLHLLRPLSIISAYKGYIQQTRDACDLLW
jgi:hypothetical protein